VWWGVMWCCLVWLGEVWCDVFSVVCCGVVFSVVWYDFVQFGLVLYGVV